MRDKADKRLWTLSIVGCVIVVLTVLFVSVKIETNNTKNRIHSTMEYIKDQYSMYNSFNEAVEARSLVRMVEKVQQTARNFKTDKQALEKEYLKQYFLTKIENNDFMSKYQKTENIVEDVRNIIEVSQKEAYRAVNTILSQRNWLIGYRIAEEELAGEGRAEYGVEIIKRLSRELTDKYG